MSDQSSSSGLQYGIVGILAGFLGLAAINPGSGPEVDENEKTTSSSFDPSSQRTFPDGNWESRVTAPLYKHIHLDPESSRTEDCAKGRQTTELRQALTNGGWCLQFLIVCVPDPINSSNGYRFDLMIETLQKALLPSSLVLDRNYLPWHDWLQAYRHYLLEAGRPGMPAGSGNLDEPIRRHFQSEPGLLVFRNNRRPSSPELTGIYRHHKRLLLVFLVGESPTIGIHKKAFQRAVDLICRWQEFEADNKLLGIKSPEEPLPPPFLRVVGPTFSGSADSLAIAIRSIRERFDVKKDRPNFRVISGSATTVDKTPFLIDAHRLDEVPPDCVNKALNQLFPDDGFSDSEQVSFATTLPYGNLVEFELVKYAKEQGFLHRFGMETNPRIGWLYESGTDYGRPPSLARHGVVAGVEIVELPFPLRISQIRGAFDKDRLTKERTRTSFAPDRYRLSIPFNEAEHATDTLTQFAPRLTAATVELTLASIFQTINREQLRCVGITATDPRDALFLASYLREFCPDVQVLMNGTDLLLTHPDYNRYLRGTLVASPYPLYPRNQLKSFPYASTINHRVPFPSMVHQGFYNAVIFQEWLTRNENDIGNLFPVVHRDHFQHPSHTFRLILPDVAHDRSWPPPLIEYGPPRSNTSSAPPSEPAVYRPGIWISVIGARGFWPLRFSHLDSAIDEDAASHQESGSTSPNPSERKTFCDQLAKADDQATTTGSESDSLDGSPDREQPDPPGPRAPTLMAASANIDAEDIPGAETKPSANTGGDLKSRMNQRKERLLGYTIAVLNRKDEPYSPPSRLGHAAFPDTAFVAACLVALLLPILLRLCGHRLYEPRLSMRRRTPWRHFPTKQDLHLVWHGLLYSIVMLLFSGTLLLLVLSVMPSPLAWVISLLGIHEPLALLGLDAHFLERTVHLSNGISIYLPFFFLTLGLATYAFAQQFRIGYFLKHQAKLEPLPEKPKQSEPTHHHLIATHLLESANAASRRVTYPVFLSPKVSPPSPKRLDLVALFVLGVSVVGMVAMLYYSRPTFEEWSISFVLFSMICVFVISWVLWLYRVIRIRSNIKEIIDRLNAFPLTSAAKRLPRSFRVLIGRFGVGGNLRSVHYQTMIDKLRQVAAPFPNNDNVEPSLVRDEDIHTLRRLLERRRQKDLDTITVNCLERCLQRRVSRLAKNAWRELIVCWTPKENRPTSGEGGTLVSSLKGARLSEEFVTMYAVAYLAGYFRQISYGLGLLMLTAVLFLFAIASYPIAPHQLLLLTGLGMVLAVTIVAILNLVQIERCDIVSAFADTKEGQVTFDFQFFLQLGVVVLPAILALVAGIFPDTLEWLGHLAGSMSQSRG
ncbi:hypothetical protein Pan216_11560 [Planctomycetes bacterium Pan216]|uniref:Uncharacterized protein n=1 Tax=Kolteria novifilia TaxID=2527975 RepID=A0A518B005_9BACT|nr:hypothetical protein Pan216_11560 [Planctomycetes bacterium Pan216]